MSDQNNFTGTDITEQFEKDDIEKNKSMAGLAYFIFFLPLLTCPDSKFAKFHANRALILLIIVLVSSVIWYMPIIGWMLTLGIRLVYVIYWILGLVDGFGGKARQLPLIGDIVIIK